MADTNLRAWLAVALSNRMRILTNLDESMLHPSAGHSPCLGFHSTIFRPVRNFQNATTHAPLRMTK